MPIASLSFGCGGNPIEVAQCDMDDTALVRGHRTHLHAALLGEAALGSRIRQVFELLALAALVALDIHHDRIAVSDIAGGDEGDEELQGIQGLSMTADQNRKIVAGDIQDKLAFVSFVFIDGDLTQVEVLQDIFQRSNRRIGDAIELLVADSAFDAVVQFRILAKILFGSHFLGFFKIHFFGHCSPHAFCEYKPTSPSSDGLAE